MLQQLKMLGEYMEERGEGGLESQLDDLSGRELFLCIDFSESDDGYKYDKVSVVQIGSGGNSADKALYKKKKGNTPDLTPTARVTRLYGSDEYTEAQKDESMKSNDTLSWNTKRWYDKEDSESDFVADVQRELNEKEDEIRDDLKEKFEETTGPDLDVNDLVLTTRYQDSGKYKIIGDFQFFRDKIREAIVSDWKSMYDVESYENSVCTVCKEKKDVYGFASPYKFYTVDNMRFAPDFDQSESWKSLPICEDCALKMKTGRKFLRNQKFDYDVGENIGYFVLPQFLSEPDFEFLDRISDEAQSDTEEALIAAEDYYEYTKDDVLNLTFLFFQGLNDDTSTSTIEKEIEDVAPSHLKKIDESAKELFTGFYGGINSYGENLTFNESDEAKKLDKLIKRVLPKPNRDSQNKAFHDKAMDLTAKILKGREIDHKSLVKQFSKECISRFKTSKSRIPEKITREIYYQQYAVRTFFFLEFLRENDLLDVEEQDTMKDYKQIVKNLDTEEDETLKQFFQDHSEAFDTPEKKAVFLEGVLSKNLMDKQRMMRETDDPPFRKKLANLRLDHDKVKQLFPEINQTLDIYNSKAEPQYKNSYTGLRETTAHYLLLSDENNWDISDKEISYFFTLGMSLNQVFKNNPKED